MGTAKLQNPPLIEVIFEIRWDLQEREDGVRFDPHAKIFPGRLSSALGEEYPVYEELPTSDIPDEISGYIVQHRFRRAKGSWPLVQVGPGIVTLNDIESYEWQDFQRRIEGVLDALFQEYPETSLLATNEVVLRYLDAYPFDFEKENVAEFLSAKLGVQNQISPAFFEAIGVSPLPIGVDFKYSFPSQRPPGYLHVGFSRGRVKGRDSVIGETIVQSPETDGPRTKDEILSWVSEAHALTHTWFFTMIEGDLLEEFACRR